MGSSSLRDVPSLLAADELTTGEVLRCALGLSSAEVEAYFVLSDLQIVTAREMSALLHRSRPTAQRLLQGLVLRGLASRQGSLIGRGGYVYHYQATPPGRVRTLVREMLEKSFRRVLGYVDKLPG